MRSMPPELVTDLPAHPALPAAQPFVAQAARKGDGQTIKSCAC
jgi:hypothetical protein